MSIYYRYKKSLGGFRSLVELMEVTPLARRQKMIELGLKEDPEYTQKALNFIISFQDIIESSNEELTEILYKVKNSMIIGYSINGKPESIKERFVKLAPRNLAADIQLVCDGKNWRSNPNDFRS